MQTFFSRRGDGEAVADLGVSLCLRRSHGRDVPGAGASQESALARCDEPEVLCARRAGPMTRWHVPSCTRVHELCVGPINEIKTRVCVLLK